MSEAFIYEAVRTPFGRYGGALAGVRPDDLAAHALRALLERAGDPDPAAIDDVILGAANGAGEDNRDVARMAALLAGLPTTVTGATVNRLCGSSLEAAIQARTGDPRGDASLIVAGGVESMTRAPWVLLKPSRRYPGRQRDAPLDDARLADGQPADARAWTISLGAERREARRDLRRSRARRRTSSRCAATGSRRAPTTRACCSEIVPVPGVELERDEGIRTDTSLEKLAQLAPAFVEGGTVTAGNSSPLNDGASMMLLGDERAGRLLGREPLARVVASAAHGVDPGRLRHRARRGREQGARARRHRLGATSTWSSSTRRSPRSRWRASRAGRSSTPRRVNMRGGAIAIGHPLGASGARILGRLAHELHARGGGYGVATLCIGVGQGLAVILEA